MLRELIYPLIHWRIFISNLIAKIVTVCSHFNKRGEHHLMVQHLGKPADNALAFLDVFERHWYFSRIEGISNPTRGTIRIESPNTREDIIHPFWIISREGLIHDAINDSSRHGVNEHVGGLVRGITNKLAAWIGRIYHASNDRFKESAPKFSGKSKVPSQ